MRTQFVQCLGFQRSALTLDAKSIPKRTSQYVGYSYRGDHCEHQEVTVTKSKTGGSFCVFIVQTGHSCLREPLHLMTDDICSLSK